MITKNVKIKNILITGSDGFLGKNLIARLEENTAYKILKFTRNQKIARLAELTNVADFIIHLAGENRPVNVEDFELVNVNLTRILCQAIHLSGRQIPLLFTSTTQINNESPYGKSKLEAERLIQNLSKETLNPALIYRLPGVFGKWCKPNYNSVVATFCHNIAHDRPVKISDPKKNISLAYVDDVVEDFLNQIEKKHKAFKLYDISQVYTISLGELANSIKSFRNMRSNLQIDQVGRGLKRALYSTYISYFPADKFTYDLTINKDPRGNFVEFLKTADSGQVSFFSITPGSTRGSHYHHTKTEKFLVLRGLVKMKFRHLLEKETYEICLNGENPKVVDSIPGWVHSIKNIGKDEALVVLWANEVFDKSKPDTIAKKVENEEA